VISKDRVNSGDVFLYHKTTNRGFYNTKFKAAADNGYDEIIFLNERDEVTEGAISNVFIKKDEKWYTPCVKSGLLAGTWRADMISKLNAQEELLTADDLTTADEVIIGNSVRGTGHVSEIMNGLMT